MRATLLGAAIAAVVTIGAVSPGTSLDAAFERFWNAKDPPAAAKVIRDVLALRPSFDEVYLRLKAGRPYSKDVARGVVQRRRVGVVGELPYTLDVPDSYDPARAYPVRFQLHGGVGREAPAVRTAGIGRLASTGDHIYILPASWIDAPWWSDLQLQNLRAILDSVKRTYNVDENRVAVSGVSDGGTGAYYVAMRDATPYACFLPLNGYLAVLGSESAGVTGDLFPINLVNRPLFVVNGGRDPLYPTASVEPSLRLLADRGVTIVYRPQPEAGHDTSWWPAVRPEFDAFLEQHRRTPLPDGLTWETSDVKRSGRLNWLVIDAIDDGAESPSPPNRSEGPHGQMQMYRQRSRSGRVDLVRSGNAVTITTRGVAQLTLLISPDQFDLAAPVTVMANGRPVFQDRVQKDVATLLKWAARDNDRAMLFAAEIVVKLK
jgi:hypothetical protein